VLAVACALACSHRATAQRYYADRHKGHRIFAWIGGGYSRLNFHLNDVVTLGYAGGSLGAGYGYSFGEHLSVNAGAEYSLLGSSVEPFRFAEEVKRVDSEGENFTMYYSFYRYRERQYAYYINIMPVSVEYAYGRFYGAAGVKVGIPLGATSVSIAADYMKTTGEYDDYIGEFEQIPDHGFDQTEVKTSKSIKFRVNITASAEVGMNIARSVQKSNPLRVAIFCDYGLANIKQSSDAVLITYEENSIEPRFNSLAGSRPQRITSFMLGLKLALFFKSPATKRIYPCFCS
jgi:hypothetical protein